MWWHRLEPGDCLALGAPADCTFHALGPGADYLVALVRADIMARRPKRSHNGGPPLDEYKGPPWGKGDPYIFLAWQAAHAKRGRRRAARSCCLRMDKAERLGLTYEEYNARDSGAGAAPSGRRQRTHCRDQGGTQAPPRPPSRLTAVSSHRPFHCNYRLQTHG